jgi:hypothetical protein
MLGPRLPFEEVSTTYIDSNVVKPDTLNVTTLVVPVTFKLLLRVVRAGVIIALTEVLPTEIELLVTRKPLEEALIVLIPTAIELIVVIPTFKSIGDRLA